MVTKLGQSIKREIEIDGDPYVVTLSEGGIKLVRKGRRKGVEVTWKALVSGDAALAAELRASLDSLPE
jgi:hypothetical protein